VHDRIEPLHAAIQSYDSPNYDFGKIFQTVVTFDLFKRYGSLQIDSIIPVGPEEKGIDQKAANNRGTKNCEA